MGFLSKLLAGFKGVAVGAQASAAQREQPLPEAAPSVPLSIEDFTFTVTYSEPEGPTVEVPAEEVNERVSRYQFVIEEELPKLTSDEQWWPEDTHEFRLQEGSDKAFAWLSPFMPLEIAKLEPLRAAQRRGPHAATTLAKELRMLIRAKRKTKEPHADLLMALYGACVAADLSEALAFEWSPSYSMIRYVSMVELESISMNFGTMGYQCIESLGKTDVKWLVEAFGEPKEHQSVLALWPHVYHNAVTRYCWECLGKPENGRAAPQARKKAMKRWLNELVRSNIGFRRECEERNATRAAKLANLSSTLDAAWAATLETYVVADLETTGLSSETDEIIEFAAVRVSPAGEVLAEFSVLVCPDRSIPPFITNLTGITQAEVDRDGQALATGMKAFLAFVGAQPVFFHNAPFDTGFLKKASAVTKLRFPNPVHDTLPMARQAWPSLGTYKLANLAKHVGAAAPTHRGLADVKATLAVLQAAHGKRTEHQ